MARMGDIQGVFAYVEQLEQISEPLRTFAHKIHQLAEELEMEQICEIAQYYLK